MAGVKPLAVERPAAAGCGTIGPMPDRPPPSTRHGARCGRRRRAEGGSAAAGA